MIKKKIIKKVVTKGSIVAPSQHKTSAQKKTPAKKKSARNNYFQRPDGSINLFDKCICVEVEFGKPGNERSVRYKGFDQAAAAAKIKKKRIKHKKSLLDSPELEAITAFDNKVRDYMYSMELENKQLRRGVYLIPIDLFEMVSAELERRKVSRQKLVDDFMRKYPERVNEARVDLGPAFDPANYPDPTVMQGKFRFEFYGTEFGVSHKIQTLDAHLHEVEAKKMSDRMRDMYFEIANNLRAGFQMSVQRLVSALTPNEDGKRPKLFDSNIENLLEFLNLFESKNIVNDTDCAKLVATAKALVKGRDAETIAHNLRTDDIFRENIHKSFSQIGKSLESMVYIDESRDIAI